MSRASTQPRVEYACGLLHGAVTDIVRSMAKFNLDEIAALDAKIAVGIDDEELVDLRALKERKIDKGILWSTTIITRYCFAIWT